MPYVDGCGTLRAVSETESLDGHVVYRADDLEARIWFGRDENRRLYAYKVEVTGPTVTPEALRTFPLSRMVAFLNGTSPAQQRAAFALAAGGEVLLVGENRWLESKRPSMKLRIPTTRKKPNSFYQGVAYRQGWLVDEGVRNPASVIAEANDVPVTTVHRWIKEARARGLLPAGQKGRAG